MPQKQQGSMAKVPLAGTGIRPELVSTPSPPHERLVIVPTHYDSSGYNSLIMSTRQSLDRLNVPEDGWRYVLLNRDDWAKAARQQLPDAPKGEKAFSNLTAKTTYLNADMFRGRVDRELLEILAHEFAHRTYVDETKARNLATDMIWRVQRRKKPSEK